MDKLFNIVENGEPSVKFYIHSDCEKTVINGVNDVAKSIKLISGADISVHEITSEQITSFVGAVVFGTFDDFPALKFVFREDYDNLLDTDGFAVRLYGGNCFIFAHNSAGVFYGANDFLESGADIVWSRGYGKEYEQFIKSKNISCKVDYLSKPAFAIRGWHTCGVGMQGNHIDAGTMHSFARNKLNGKVSAYEDSFNDWGVHCVANLNFKWLDCDRYIDEFPNAFMRDFNGNIKRKSAGASFLNYYDPKAAELLASNYIEALESDPNLINRGLDVITSDDPHFCMVGKNGEFLHTLPFTADNGVTVYPDQVNYKSTVYWNFLNRFVKIIAKRFPEVRLSALAYMYAEPCPAVALDEHLTARICVIGANDRLAFTDDNSMGAKKITDNIVAWCEKCPETYMYNYWMSFKGQIYSRPIAKVVQKNLQYYEKIGVYGLLPEGKLDKAEKDGTDIFFDMNEMYIWQCNKLFWDPYLDLNALTDKFCRVVYGKAADDMKRYYALLQKGYDERDSYVVYHTGGNVYIKDFIINAGVKDDVLNALESALSKKLTKVQQRKIQAIYNVVKAEIEKYSQFIEEDAFAVYTDVNQDVLLSQQNLAVDENPSSPWNKAGEIKIFKSYVNFKDFAPEADLSVRILYDDNYIYFGYRVKDDMLLPYDGAVNALGIPLYKRSDGTTVTSYAETYIGGNSLNREKYYGYITGLYPERGRLCYLNAGAPVGIKMPENYKDAFYIHVGDNPKDSYYFHVQAISFNDLGVELSTASPYGSIVYYSNRYGRVGWKGTGLWDKAGFSEFKLKK